MVSAVLLSGVLEGLVFGVPVIDPPTYLAVTLAFAAVAFLACYLPGRAALRVDPVNALREE